MALPCGEDQKSKGRWRLPQCRGRVMRLAQRNQLATINDSAAEDNRHAVLDDAPALGCGPPKGYRVANVDGWRSRWSVTATTMRFSGSPGCAHKQCGQALHGCSGG